MYILMCVHSYMYMFHIHTHLQTWACTLTYMYTHSHSHRMTCTLSWQGHTKLEGNYGHKKSQPLYCIWNLHLICAVNLCCEQTEWLKRPETVVAVALCSLLKPNKARGIWEGGWGGVQPKSLTLKMSCCSGPLSWSGEERKGWSGPFDSRQLV